MVVTKEGIMPRSSRRQFIQLLTVVTAAGLLPKDETIVEAKGKKAPSLHVDEARPVVSRHKIVTTAPPSHIPKATSADALFLGNGDLLAAFAGEAHQPQFWVTTNDFWELREWGGPRPLGRIIFEMPELANAKYDCSLDLVSATLTATFTSGAVVVTMASWIAADTNLLVVEFACSGGSVDGQVSFCFPDEIGYGVAANDYWNYSGSTLDRLNHLPFQEKQWANGLLSADRTYNIETDQVSRLTMAARFIEPSAAPGGDGKFHLKQDSKITFTAVFRSWFKTVRPLDAVRYAASTISAADILDHRKQHQQWWDRYWSTSIVEIPDPTIELQYYRSHYNMGSLSRDPDFPPCDYGLSTSDDPVSCADYKIDYNYQAGFLGLNVAGRFEQTVVYDSPGLAHLPRACADAVKLLGHGGAYMSLGLGPRGMVPEHIWLGMKSQNAFYLVNTAERWYLTRDIEYARRVYPLVREVARFWEQDLTLVKGHYPVIDDSGQEMTGHHCVNNSAGIAFVQLAMRLALDISAQLNVDADTHDLWRHILANVGPLPIRDAGTLHSVFSSPGMDLQNIFPKGSLKGKPIIAFEGEGIDYSFEGIQTFPIYPAGQIGLSSDPKLLQAAHNTVGLRVWSEDSGNKWPGPKPGDIGGAPGSTATRAVYSLRLPYESVTIRK
jgi:hypothetical protein